MPPSARVALLNAPPSAVTVWGALSVLVHVTVVPFVTVRFAGENAKLTIDATTPPLAGGGGVGFGVGFGVGAAVAVGLGDAVGFGVGGGVVLAVGAGVGRAAADGAGVGFGDALGDRSGDRSGDASGNIVGAADPPPPVSPSESVLVGEAAGG